MSVGYTEKQAERLKERIDRQMAKVEQAVSDLGFIVPDTKLNAYFGVMQLEELRELAEELKTVVDRRRRV